MHYFDFATNDKKNLDLDSDSNGEFQYLGTGIYYKIYNNTSSLESQRSSIVALNTTSNGSSAATRMIQTLGFQQLGTKPNMSWSPFIPSSAAGSHRIRFRLKNISSAVTPASWSVETVALISKNYNASQYCGVSASGGETSYTYDSATDTWSGGITLATQYPSSFVIPYRYDNERSFDFFDDNDDDDNKYDVEPVNGDADYYYNSSSSASDTYYVQFFAVALGRDTSDYSMSYSLVLDLGSVPIAK